MKGTPHLVPAIKIPLDPKNLVLNEEEEKPWTEEEDKIIEEKSVELN